MDNLIKNYLKDEKDCESIIEKINMYLYNINSYAEACELLYGVTQESYYDRPNDLIDWCKLEEDLQYYLDELQTELLRIGLNENRVKILFSDYAVKNHCVEEGEWSENLFDDFEKDLKKLFRKENSLEIA